MTLLSLVVLSIIACTSVISALSTHGEIERGPDNLYSASNGASNVRNLKQNATSDQPTVIEDRTFGLSTFTPAVSSMRIPKAERPYWTQLQHLQQPKKTPEDTFEFFKLHTGAKEDIFERPAFTVWYKFVHNEFPDTAGNVIIETMLKHRSVEDLTTLLLRAVRSPKQKKVGRETYGYLLAYLERKHENNFNEVFKLLGLDGKDARIEVPENFFVWMDYVKTSDKTGREYPNIWGYKMSAVDANSVDAWNIYYDEFVPLVRPKKWLGVF